MSDVSIPDRETLKQKLELIVAEARLQFQVNLQIAEKEGIEQSLRDDKLTEEVVVNQILSLVFPESEEQ